MRIISGLKPRDHTSSEFKKYNILKFNDIIAFKSCIYIYKCLNNLQPTLIEERYKKVSESHKYNTRSSNFNLVQIPAKTMLKRFCLSVVGVTKFNELPKEIKTAKSEAIFKKKLKLFLMKDY